MKKTWTEEERKAFGAKMKAAKAAKLANPKTEIDELRARIAELEKVKPSELTIDEQLLNAYQTGRNSIQDLARIFSVSVDHILNLVGEGGLSSVRLDGDMIDQDEAGREVPMNYGKDIPVPYTVD